MQHFPEFYEENSTLLVFASIALTLSTCFRGCYNILLSWDTNIFMTDDYLVYKNVAIFFLCDVVPIVF